MALGEKEWLEKSVQVLNSALVRRTTVVLEKNEDKVKLSMFNFRKSRQVGHRYFAKGSKDIHITFNLKTKNFYITNSHFAHRRRTTSTTNGRICGYSTRTNRTSIYPRWCNRIRASATCRSTFNK